MSASATGARHVVAALLDEGHAVRVLARRPDRVPAALEPLGRTTDDVEVVQGDVLGGPEALAAAMDGADAVLHAANVYSLNQADEQRMREVNVDGTRAVLHMVLGPRDPNLGDSTQILRSLLTDPVSVNATGLIPVVDVRDLGIAHARILAVDRPARRYLFDGRAMTMAEFRDVAREVTGRRLPLLPAPAPMLRVVGKVADAVQRRGVDPGFSSMNLYILMHGVPVDDRAEQEALGVRWRPVEDTLRDTIEWLHEAGHLVERHAGEAATDRAAASG